ncbi:Gfo/Idh/MocA family protein [Promicromonospora citrea]|uniref:Oxidoreductase n=1 Tax=Promicromonospora citrea TaxID=43677 RepID=A0A8H9GT59_9MICO|nr:Gfo/Idh/MocA family oxidoreductase [Promicromonospora citrea]NNH54286.1 Gfo/Idh/MocA family oxidoreductase [Promicromonospora citrea]GGM43336.1 oxidoreductase [Promicromonospora citrea]
MSQDRIRVGIIGVHPERGWATTAHIPALQQLAEFELTAVSHHDHETAAAAARKYNVPHALSTASDLINHPDVDLVVVAVKVTRHEELVTSAIEAGKAVFCEWPLGVHLDQAVRMRDLARARGITTAIGLQARATPPFAYMRDLVRDGYVGEVLSSTMIGAGVILGESMSRVQEYTLNPENGIGLQHVMFAHSIDALLHVLDGRFADMNAFFATRRSTVRIEETGEVLPMSVPDQLVVNGTLENGPVVAAHFRGGLSRGTNFHFEINGTKGDLLLTSPVGYTGTGGFTLRGATGTETPHALVIPGPYGADRFVNDPAQGVASAYAQLASDLKSGTHLSPTFDDGVELHELIDRIERSGGLERHRPD